MAQQQVNARLPEDLTLKLDRIARISGRSKAWHLQKAVASYIDRESQFFEAVQRGKDDVAAGRTVPHEQAKAEFAAWVEEYSAKPVADAD
jgi:predicted transcriptional regulator